MVVLNPKNIQIIKNTTRFNNEIIKQRIGCIPVHIKAFEGIENLIIELNAENKHDSLVYITTKNFKIKNKLTDTYLTEQAIKKIFPSNKITDSYILIARLRPKISDIIPEYSDLSERIRKSRVDGITKFVKRSISSFL